MTLEENRSNKNGNGVGKEELYWVEVFHCNRCRFVVFVMELVEGFVEEWCVEEPVRPVEQGVFYEQEEGYLEDHLDPMGRGKGDCSTMTDYSSLSGDK